MLGTEQLTPSMKSLLPNFLDLPETIKKKFEELINSQKKFDTIPKNFLETVGILSDGLVDNLA
jgi:hypothetical protein